MVGWPRIADAVSGQGAAPQDARYMVVRLCIEVRPLFQRDFCRFRLCSVFPLFFRSFAGTLGKILRTFDHDCPEALLAIAGAASAKRVVGDAVSMVEEERPFQAFFSAHSRHIFHAPIFRLSGVMVW